jgi:hypothetical protein
VQPATAGTSHRLAAVALCAVIVLAGRGFGSLRTIAASRDHARDTVAFVADWVPRATGYRLGPCRLDGTRTLRCPFAIVITALSGGTTTCKARVRVDAATPRPREGGTSLVSKFTGVRCVRKVPRAHRRGLPAVDGVNVPLDTAGERPEVTADSRGTPGTESRPRPRATEPTPCGAAAHPECEDLWRQVAATAHAACAQELPANQDACNAQADDAGLAALARCLNDDNANGPCGPCEACYQGVCTSTCLLSCAPCDAATGTCVDTCPTDQYCSRLGGSGNGEGGCLPKCPEQCAPYDPATEGCRDTCTESNPCMVCRQNQCQSACPDRHDYCQDDGSCRHCDASRCQHMENGQCVGCDTTCETCENGTCVSKCGAGLTCCVGQCLNCCHAFCDRPTGLCTGNPPQECSDAQTCCDTGCADLTTDRDNCGTCGHQCQLDIETCLGGQCRQLCDGNVCQPGQLCCPGASGFKVCVDPQTDSDNCYRCGNVCPAGYHCEGGTCARCTEDAQCPTGHCCGGQCVDTQNDPNDCGSCGNVCPSGESCQSGTCAQPACGNPPVYCGGARKCCTYTPPPGVLGGGVTNGVCYDPSVDFCCPTWGACAIGWTCCPQCCFPQLICCADPNRCGLPDGTGC